MATAPASARVRSYNVGFGDCFLLTFSYADGDDRHVLIDFGSTKLATSGPKGGLLAVAKKIKEHTAGKLHVLIATHRHADHISGFGGRAGEVIASLDPDLVVQPWTEDPELDPNAQAPAAAGGGGAGRARARALVARLSDMQALAAAVVAQAPRLRDAEGIPKTLAEQIHFLGETNIKNEEAVRNLMTMGKKHVYASFGTKLPIKRLLPGLGVDVLGPPTLEESAAIAEQARVDSDEFWHIAARRVTDGRGARAGADRLFPGAKTARPSAQETRWVIPRISRVHAEEMLAIVRMLDGVLNNTSLILLFEVGESLLLFPGDAQLENWRYALRDAKGAARIRSRLSRARFYKVGHHGSLNATPKSLWNSLELRNADTTVPDRLVTMVSTASGKHGSMYRRTEVPRRTLIEALTEMSTLYNTQRLRSQKTFWNEVELPLP